MRDQKAVNGKFKEKLNVPGGFMRFKSMVGGSPNGVQKPFEFVD